VSSTSATTPVARLAYQKAVAWVISLLLVVLGVGRGLHVRYLRRPRSAAPAS
jgi:hypothetical protein